jgi:LysM repeat protein
MKIIKILGIAAGLHAVLAIVLILASPGCSNTKAAAVDSPPISAAPAGPQDAAQPAPASDSAVIRYSPTRPGTAVASALEEAPVSDVVPATTYTVAHGDSLSSVAKRNKITKSDLAAANNLRLTSVLHVGQKLVIPSKGVRPEAAEPAMAAAVPAAAAPAGADKASGEVQKHVVAAGETLGGIARMYHVKQGDIAVANNITDPRRIQPGQELVIPLKSAGASSRPSRASAEASRPQAPPAGDQDLDAGLKPSGDVPAVKVEDPNAAPQPKNP